MLLQLRVGGQAARQQDETWPLECGCVGQETTGAGGLAKALRTVPVVLDIAERVRRRNPDAWIVDFTNPVGIVTRALLQAGHRAVGLCNVAIGFQRRFAALLGVEPDRRPARPRRAQPPDLGAGASGVRRRGPCCPTLLAGHGDEIAADLGLPRELLRRLGVVPSYYLRYFYAHDEVVARAADPALAGRRGGRRSSDELLEMYADPALDEKPALLGEARRRVLLRGRRGSWPRALLGDGPDGVDAGRQHPQRRHAAVPARRRGDRGAGAGRPPRAPRPLPVEPLEPLYAGLIARTSRRTSTWRSTPRCAAAGTGCSRPCWRTRWSARSTSPTS